MQRRKFLQRTATLLASIATITITPVVNAFTIAQEEPVLIIPKRWVMTTDGVTKVVVGEEGHFDTISELEQWMAFNHWDLLDIVIVCSPSHPHKDAFSWLNKISLVDQKLRVDIQLWSEYVKVEEDLVIKTLGPGNTLRIGSVADKPCTIEMKTLSFPVNRPFELARS